MKIKDGVIMAGLDIKMRPALIAAGNIWRKHGQELVITAGLEGEHSAGSLHYYGLALDFRTRYFEEYIGQDNIVIMELRDALGKDFDVIRHSTHCHCEYDPK